MKYHNQLSMDWNVKMINQILKLYTLSPRYGDLRYRDTR